ncbi:MAG: ATP-binding protein [Pseudomonadota bacterium]
MRLTFARRLLIGMLVLLVATISVQTVATRISFDRGFSDYVAEQDREQLRALAAAAATVYAQTGDWSVLRDSPRRWDQLLRAAFRPPDDRRPPPPRRGPGPAGRDDPLRIRDRITLFDGNGDPVAGPRGNTTPGLRESVSSGDQTVGTLVLRPQHTANRAPIDAAFASSQNQTMLISGLVALVIAAIVATLLARHFTGPVRDLAGATRALRSGDYARRVRTKRDDELGRLGDDFNALAETLERNRVDRRRWVSDIAHELRTPLAVLSGELEAIADGVRELDEQAIASLQDEAKRLVALVDDLNQLASSDRGEIVYRFEVIDLANLLEEALGRAQPSLSAAGIQLSIRVDEALRSRADPNRMRQVVDNLIENVRRYTDTPGELHVDAVRRGSRLRICFDDTAPGVPPAHHDYLFERLYRVDESRNRASGGAGLGLAICRTIIEAHGGHIEAGDSPLGGLRIVIDLPVQE